MKFPLSIPDSMPVKDFLRQMLNHLRASKVISINGIPGQESPNGTMFNIPVGGPSTPATVAGTKCYLGELETWTEGEGEEAVSLTGIRGGMVYCGDRNFSVPRYEIDMETDGVWLVFLRLGCEVNRDDDGEIILPGILTSAETDPADFWEFDTWTAGPPETQYPDNTPPDVATGLGEIIIPLGKLTIAAGVASFVSVDCGNVTITQCGGTLAHTRA